MRSERAVWVKARRVMALRVSCEALTILIAIHKLLNR